MQSAEIDVDEEGTRAAATTVASVVVASAIPDAITVRFDRPFLFVLRDRDRGIALFIGRVGDPSRGGPS
jgi:serine protease inhibitor